MSKLATIVKVKRESLGLTRSTLAEKVSISPQAVSALELGKSAIGHTKFKAFGKALKIKPVVLIDAWLFDVKVRTLKANGVRIAKV